MPKNDIIRYCDNNAVNALLNYYRNTAEENGIKCTFEIDIPGELTVKNPELCSMFGNILDNAVIACSEAPEAGLMADICPHTATGAVSAFDQYPRLRIPTAGSYPSPTMISSFILI